MTSPPPARRGRRPLTASLVVLALLGGLAVACGGGRGAAPAGSAAPSTSVSEAAAEPRPSPPASGPGAPGGSPAGGQACDGAPVPAPRQPGFEGRGSRLVSRATPRHGVTDALSVAGAESRLAGRFQYGRLRVDLDRERVEVWLDDCSPEARFVTAATTDDDGVVEVTLPPVDLEAGRYAIHVVVAGDGTFASGFLVVVPGGTEVTVFDVDGTLTVGDDELLAELAADFFEEVAGGRSPEARAGAAEATRLHARAGRLVVYLTGRPVWLAEPTRDWLHDRGAASGVLRMPARDSASRPTEAGVGATKRAELAAIVEAGLVIHDAYGNASTDVSAYRAAGLPDPRIRILGDSAPPGVDALGDGFDEHNAGVAADLGR